MYSAYLEEAKVTMSGFSSTIMPFTAINAFAASYAGCE